MDYRTMFSCKRIPIRIWIIVLIFLNWFLMTSIAEHVHICWKMMIERKGSVTYKPWCQLSADEKKIKLSNPALKIPWRNNTAADFGPRFNWTNNQVSILISAQLYGHMISAVPGGIISEYVGPYYVILYTTTTAAVLNSLRVLFAHIEWNVLMVSEFVLGLHIGSAFPALLVWMARWAPPNERGIFVASQIGSGLASSFATIFTRLLAPVIGWRGTFYNLSAITFLYILTLWALGCNHPEDHKLITEEELLYIKKTQRGRATATRSFPPFRHILSSKAFWALNILHFGYICAVRYFLSSMPNYLNKFIGISRRTVEFIEIFPKFGFVTAAVLICILGDVLRKKRLMDDLVVVKVNTIFSHFIPGCALFFIGIAHCNQTISVVLLFIGYTASGCAILSCFRTIIDLSPNYAGTIYGLMNLWSCIVIIANPLLAALILKYNDGIVGWTIFFLIGGGCLIGTGVIFMFFGIEYGQWWNLKSQDRFKLYLYKRPKRLQVGQDVQQQREVGTSSQDTKVETNQAKSKNGKPQSTQNKILNENHKPKAKGRNNQLLYHVSKVPMGTNIGKAAYARSIIKRSRYISCRTEIKNPARSTKRKNESLETKNNKKIKT